MTLTPNQLQEAVELGDESYGIGATSKPTVAQVALSFKPPFTSLDQFRAVVRKLTVDGGAITTLNKTGVVVVATLEPDDLAALRPGNGIFKIGRSTVTVLKVLRVK